jgi:hypothetical protein
LSTDNDNDESSSQKTLIEWSQADEPLDVPEQYFEADGEPEVKKVCLSEREGFLLVALLWN